MMSYCQSQIKHDLNCSPFAPIFSRRYCNPLSNESRIESAKSVPQFQILRQKEYSNNALSPFDPPHTLSPKTLKDGECETKGLTKSDVADLKILIETAREKYDKNNKYKETKEPIETGILNSGIFKCKHCDRTFNRSQALGGHMSRKHPGKSTEYKIKKNKRKTREVERLRLHIAKRKYFAGMNYSYDELFDTPQGRRQAQRLINRAAIKKIKKEITKEEINNFFEYRFLNEIKKNS